MFKTFLKRTAPYVMAMGLGLALIPQVNKLASYRDMQTAAYDAGLQALAANSPAQAFGDFKLSINAYKSATHRSFWANFFLPQPDQELAALAYFQEGNILASVAQKPKEGMLAYLNSLRLNNGQLLIPGVTPRDDPAHQYGVDYCIAPSDKVGLTGPVTSAVCQLRRLQKEAEDTRNNMQALLDQHPELAKMLANDGKSGSGNKGNTPAQGKRGGLPSSGNPGGQGFTHNAPTAI